MLTRPLQDCLQLYLQGAGAPGPSSTGRDGKEKLETDMRMFCLQVVDTVLIQKWVDFAFFSFPLLSLSLL